MVEGIDRTLLAANVALGRNYGGIHYRSDYTQSLRLGELVAISALAQPETNLQLGFRWIDVDLLRGTKISV